jgi:hypothetical protein
MINLNINYGFYIEYKLDVLLSGIKIGFIFNFFKNCSVGIHDNDNVRLADLSTQV